MKYEITDVPHPRCPWLHRIRALKDINEKVPKGSLGGYIQSENNLSQEGTCWIYDQAVCCEDAAVEKEAGLFDGAIARDTALITGNAVLYDRAVAEGHCCIRSGEIKEDTRVSGNALIRENQETKLSPLIGGHSRVYGTVSGNFIIKGIVRPGENLENPTKDFLILENERWEVLAEVRKLAPPKCYQKQEVNRKNQQQR